MKRTYVLLCGTVCLAVLFSSTAMSPAQEGTRRRTGPVGCQSAE